MEHTPGPWYVEVQQTWGMCVRTSGKQRTRISDGKPEDAYIASRLPGNADARLIAAAPELLEAAQFALRVFENANIDGNWWVPSKEKIEAAIKKATESS